MSDPGADAPTGGQPNEDPLIGRTLNGRFRLLQRIGVGGMGKVYKAVQEPLDRLVAVKVLSPSYSPSKDPDFRRRFSLEASLTSKLRHPNTVTVIDYGQTGDGIYFIAMEYLVGKTLSEVLRLRGALPWPRALDIAQQICRSLREAHTHGVIHRDLKPANIMLLDQDHEHEQDLVKVLDFGLVKSFLSQPQEDVALTQAGVFLGSPQYMAPEQARHQVSPRSDIYSLGVVLYHMLVGRPPFHGKDALAVVMQHVSQPPATFASVRPDLAIPAEVEQIVQKCLAKDPQKRFGSMNELMAQLRRTLGLPDGSSPNTGPRTHPTPGPAHPAPLFGEVAGHSVEIELDSTVGIFANVYDKPKNRFWYAVTFGAALALSFFLVLALSGRTEPPKPAAPPPAAAAPVPKTIHFRVGTTPSGAWVTVGGKKMGRTPASFDLPAGPSGEARAELVLTLDGYQQLSFSAAGMGPEVVVNEKLLRRKDLGRR